VPRVIQISALGAEQGRTGYFTSKRRADEYLMTLPLAWTVVRPALVFGVQGTSAALFSWMASLPVIPLPGRGTQELQPVHIDDVVQALVKSIEEAAFERACVPLAGPTRTTYRNYLVMLRRALMLERAHFVPIPWPVMRIAASIAGLNRHAMMDRQTLDMLAQGNTGDAEPLRRALDREPRAPDAFISPEEAPSLRLRAKLSWLLPLLRLSLAALWIWTGIVSFGLYDTAESYALLARLGADGAFASVLLYGAALLDLLLGLSILWLTDRRKLWLTQIAVMLGYTVLISIWLPEFWLHPYGPILKNLPILAGTLLLYFIESEVAWNTSS
jgi:hypothetical protein